MATRQSVFTFENVNRFWIEGLARITEQRAFIKGFDSLRTKSRLPFTWKQVFENELAQEKELEIEKISWRAKRSGMTLKWNGKKSAD